MTDCCNENHGADHVHDHTELDHDTDEKPVVIDPGESRIPKRGSDFDAHFTNFNPDKGVRDAYIAYAKVDGKELDKDPTLSHCVLIGADFTAGRYVEDPNGDTEENGVRYRFVPDPEGPDVRIARRYTSHFDRIRRITGYLVGTVDRWNSAKQHELHDRKFHGIAHEATVGHI